MAGHRPCSIVARICQQQFAKTKSAGGRTIVPAAADAGTMVRRPAGPSRSRRSSAAPPDCRRSRAREESQRLRLRGSVPAEARFAGLLRVEIGVPLMSVWWVERLHGLPSICSHMIFAGNDVAFSFTG
jgi:hypothetical protein